MGKGSSAPVIGYKYFLGVHKLWCHGPVDNVQGIWVEDRQAWDRVQEGDGKIEVSAASLFGETEGGISGSIDFYTGTPTQTPNPYLTTILGSGVPAFRNICQFILNGTYIGNNPYLKPWSVKVQRINKRIKDGAVVDQWLPAYASIGGDTGTTLEIKDNSILFGLDISDFAYGGKSFAQGSLNYQEGPYSTVTGQGDLRKNKQIIVDTLQYMIDSPYFKFGQNDVGVAGLFYSDNLSDYEGLFYKNASENDLKRLIEFVQNLSVRSSGGNFKQNEGSYWNTRVKAAVTDFFAATGTTSRQRLLFEVATNITNQQISDGSAGLDIQNILLDGTSVVLMPRKALLIPVTPRPSDTYENAYAIWSPNIFWVAINIPQNNAGSIVGYVNESQSKRAFINTIPISSYTATKDRDMNPAHIIRECLTDQQWGLGLSEDDIDDASFEDAAVTLFTEGFGLSMAWVNQSSMEDFLQVVLNHIDASLYVRRDTGKWTLKLIRADYDINDLVVFDDSDIVSWKNLTRRSPAEVINSVTVNYNDRTLRNQASLTVNNLAQVQQLGQVVPTSVNYAGIWKASLAARVAERDLRTLSSQIISGEITVTRLGTTLYPADVFRISSSRYGLSGEVFRVLEISVGDGRDNQVTIKFSQDVYALNDFPIVVSPDSEFIDPALTDTTTDISTAVVEEQPYYTLIRSLGEVEGNSILADEPDAGTLLVAAGKPDVFSTSASVLVDAGEGFANLGTINYAPYATIPDGLPATGDQVTITLAGGSKLDQVSLSQLAYINGEIVRVDTFVTNNTVTISRGCLDTVPKEHPANSKIIFFGGSQLYSTAQYVASDEVDVRLLSTYANKVSSSVDAPEYNLVMDSRAIRPYPAGNFKINGLYNYAEWTGTLSLTWSHRDRTLQTGSVPQDYTFGDIGPETGVTYTLQARKIGFNVDSVLFTTTGITANTASVDTTLYDVSDAYMVVFTITSVRGGYTSWQDATSKVIVVQQPADLIPLAGLWVDAGTPSSLYEDMDKTDPVDYDGESVTRAENLKGTLL